MTTPATPDLITSALLEHGTYLTQTLGDMPGFYDLSPNCDGGDACQNFAFTALTNQVQPNKLTTNLHLRHTAHAAGCTALSKTTLAKNSRLTEPTTMLLVRREYAIEPEDGAGYCVTLDISTTHTENGQGSESVATNSKQLRKHTPALGDVATTLLGIRKEIVSFLGTTQQAQIAPLN